MELHKLTMKVLTGIRETAYACMQSLADIGRPREYEQVARQRGL